MDRSLETAHLKTLIAVVDEGGFEAAANKIGRTQSAVTQQIKTLEDIVGKKIFVSRGRRKELTSEGQILLRNAREIITLCKQTLSATRNSFSTTTLRLGSPLEVADDFLPRILRRFADAWPQVRVVLRVGRSEELMELMSAGGLDMTLSTWRMGAKEGKLVRKLPIHWISSADYALDTTKPLPLVLTNAPSVFRHICLSALDIAGWTYFERITTYNTAGVRFAVEAGLGITARTTTAFRPDIQILDEAYQLPVMQPVSYYIHRAGPNQVPELDDLYEAIVELGANQS